MLTVVAGIVRTVEEFFFTIAGIVKSYKVAFAKSQKI